MPGMTVAPLASSTSASAGREIEPSGPAATIVAPSSTIAARTIGSRSVPSKRVAFEMMVTILDCSSSDSAPDLTKYPQPVAAQDLQHVVGGVASAQEGTREVRKAVDTVEALHEPALAAGVRVEARRDDPGKGHRAHFLGQRLDFDH